MTPSFNKSPPFIMKVSKNIQTFHKSINIGKIQKEVKEVYSDDFLNLNIFCEISSLPFWPHCAEQAMRKILLQFYFQCLLANCFNFNSQLEILFMNSLIYDNFLVHKENETVLIIDGFK